MSFYKAERTLSVNWLFFEDIWIVAAQLGLAGELRDTDFCFELETKSRDQTLNLICLNILNSLFWLSLRLDNQLVFDSL